MQPFDAYSLYNALKLHFGGKYDAIKYNFKTSANPKTFWKRKDKYFFAKVAKRFNDPSEAINYYVAHFIAGNEWIGNMINDEDTYLQWTKRQESLGYLFEQDLTKLEDKVDSFDELFIIKSGTYPLLIEEYMADEISLETIAILESYFGMIKKLDKKITDTLVWPDIKIKVEAYAPFVKMDKEKIKKIVLKVFTK